MGRNEQYRDNTVLEELQSDQGINLEKKRFSIIIPGARHGLRVSTSILHHLMEQVWVPKLNIFSCFSLGKYYLNPFVDPPEAQFTIASFVNPPADFKGKYFFQNRPHLWNKFQTF